MPQIKWSLFARESLIRCAERIKEKRGKQAANKVTRKIRESIANLQENPLLGISCAYNEVEIKKLIIPFGRSGYRAYYIIDEKSLIILLSINHQSEKEPALSAALGAEIGEGMKK